jgi:hypothetical protein
VKIYAGPSLFNCKEARALTIVGLLRRGVGEPTVGLEDMNSLVLWMAEQVCSLSLHIGLSACSTTSNFYQVGVAGWIFGGFGLLMLLGIAEAFVHRRAAQEKQVVQDNGAASFIVVTTIPIRPNNHSVVASRFRHSRVRPFKRAQRDKLAALGQSAPRA